MSKKRRRIRQKAVQKTSRSAQKAIDRHYKASLKCPSGKTVLAAAIIIVCVVVGAVHWLALSAQALCFDDHQYMVDNPLVKNPGWASTSRFLSEVLEPSTVEGYYQPLTMISLMVDYALGGRCENLRQFHRTSIGLHIANTALIIVLLYLLFGQIWVAAAVGGLFGLHPMTVESICWLCDRKTLLAAFFALWSLIFYLKYSRKNNLKFYVGCLLMYVLALMSKPTSLLLPAAMLLLDYWPLRRLSRRSIVEKLPFFFAGLIFAYITFISQSRTADLVAPVSYEAGRIPLTLCHNIVFYLYKVVWPAMLIPNYVFPEPMSVSNPVVAAGVVGTFVLIVLLLVSLRRSKGPLTGWLFFFIMILPTMQIFRFSNVIAADKFAYLPSVGLLIVLAWFIGLLWGKVDNSKTRARRAGIIIVLLILFVAEAALTRRQSGYWQNTVGLYEHMLPVSKNSPWVHYDLANALLKEGKLDRAVEHYKRTLEIKPDDVNAHYNLGNALKLQGKLDDAMRHYNKALEGKEDYAEVLTNMANIFSMQGRREEAIRYFKRSLSFTPDSAIAHSNLGWELKGTGRFDEAIEHFLEAARLSPELVPPLLGMAETLASHPDSDIHDTGRAVELAERAATLTKYQQAAILEILGRMYALDGKFERAVTTAEKAVELAVSKENYRLVNRLRGQIELYKEGKAGTE